MKSIFYIDQTLFYLINKDLESDLTNWLMPILTDSDNWMPIYIFIFIYLIFIDGFLNNNNRISNYFLNFWRNNRKGIIFAFMLAIGITLADQISSSLIKEWVGRIRPCHTLENVNLLVNCGGGKSFPSSHATNNFYAAGVLSYYFRNSKWIFYILASLVALSRVFVGVHYPIDIAAGAILGTLIAILIINIYKVIIKNLD